VDHVGLRKIAIADALGEAGGNAASQAKQASHELSRAMGVLLGRAQAAGAVRTDSQLPGLYALVVGMSRASPYGQLDQEVQTRALGVVFDGLAGPGAAGAG
jgi:hypothetical protein